LIWVAAGSSFQDRLPFAWLAVPIEPLGTTFTMDQLGFRVKTETRLSQKLYSVLNEWDSDTIRRKDVDKTASDQTVSVRQP
jgi:hypothetical protein